MSPFRLVHSALALSLAAGCQPAEQRAVAVMPLSEPGDVVVLVDSTRHEIMIQAGPELAGAGHHAHGSGHGSHRVGVPLHAKFPVDGWLRGYSLEILDDNGMTLPDSLLHHLVVVNYDRRQLVHPIAERIVGIGSETGEVRVPVIVGVPMSRGQRLGIYTAWRAGADPASVRIHLTLFWTPRNGGLEPRSVFPAFFDANAAIGEKSEYDLPPGRSRRSYEFSVPVAGRLVHVGGHMHDYALMVRLEDATTGKSLVTIRPERDDDGRVLAVERAIPGFLGVRLEEGRRYRVVGVYDNPASDTLRGGGMAHLIGMFLPDDPSRWPAVDTTNAAYLKDLASIAAPTHGY